MAFDLNNVRNIEVQRNYKWLLTINGFEFNRLLIEAITFPTKEFTADSFHLGGGEIFLPSFARVGVISIEFIEDNKGNMLRLLETWKNDVVNEQGVFGYPKGVNGFKKQGLLLLLDGKNEKHTEIKLEDMFPLRLSSPRMSYDASNKVPLIQDFSVDSIKIV